MHSDGILKLALVSLLVASGCSSSDGGGGAETPSHSPVPATNATTAALLPTDAQALPDFDEAKYDQLIGQLKGTPVVVNIWGSWCGPCRDEAPDLAAAAKEYGDRVQFIGVNILDTKDGAARYMDEFGLDYPSVFDPSANGDIRNHLGYLGQPDTVFYDASGNKVSDWEGAITPEELTARIESVLGSPTPPL